MLISLITPCRNAASLLPDTIVSIQSQRAVLSGRLEVEHIIIDGASTDGTKAVVEGFPQSKFFSEPDEGMYDALGKGLRMAQGDIVGYLNAGDILFPWAFDVLADVFSDGSVQWATGYSTTINDQLQVTSTWKPTRYRREFVQNGFYVKSDYPHAIQQESTFWSKELNAGIEWDALKRFRLAGDYFLWTQFSRRAELHSIMTQLGAFRVHQGQLSEARDAYLAEALRIVREPSFREELTKYWEIRCNPMLRNALWNFVLPPSKARIFEFSNAEHKWLPR